MDKVIIYGKKGLQEIEKILDPFYVITCGNKRELIFHIIEEKNIRCFLFFSSVLNNDDLDFLKSFRKHFPIARIGLFYRGAEAPDISGITVFCYSADNDFPADKLKDFTSEGKPENRRAHNRFEWILQGELKNSEDSTERYEIHSFSAGGAFLKSLSQPLPEGTITDITVRFANVTMTAKCEVLSPRNASSNLPFGFPIRFLNLSEESQSAINTIVSDALFRIIIDPEDGPEIPALDEELLTPDFQLI